MAFSFGFRFAEDASIEPAAAPVTALASCRSANDASFPGIPAAIIPWACDLLPSSKSHMGSAYEHVRAVDIGFGLKKALVDADSVTGLHRDVVSGAYEGGAKVWECTRDLLSYLTSDESLATVRGARVFDMGCGAGLLGCAALQHGAKSIIFQDLNAEVIRNFTQPTVFENVGAATNCIFLSGSWETIRTCMLDKTNEAFCHIMPVDLVLASEVLYDERYYTSILELLCTLLEINGQALIATKRFYYGVGGGVAAFSAFIAASYPSFTVSVIQSFEDGVSMIRDVLRLKRHS